jgi:two-component system sensor histidine kinase EvgS
MLRRLIGEDIELSWQPCSRRLPVFIDPSQLDQLLANLCINARDAIGGVGKLTIETGWVCFDTEYCDAHVGFISGDFVMLAVSDDGCGMDKDTIDNIFEPFFTTKGLGEGTGLGLSTVFGIVKQNKGFINVYSEPGEGTTFKIYLPPHAENGDIFKMSETENIPTGSGETVLIVEDEPSILKMSQQLMENSGYLALAASTPNEALALAKEHEGEIHLLITDVVMPKMNGRRLAEKLQIQYPALKVLFMSGYTANVIAHRGVLDRGINFIQKPFSKKDLALKVREVLEKKDAVYSR